MFRLLSRFISASGAALASAFFLVHPAHCETVLFAVGSAEILALLLMITACMLHIRPSPRAPFLGAAVFFLALASKENAALLFPILVG